MSVFVAYKTHSVITYTSVKLGENLTGVIFFYSIPLAVKNHTVYYNDLYYETMIVAYYNASNTSNAYP